MVNRPRPNIVKNRASVARIPDIFIPDIFIPESIEEVTLEDWKITCAVRKMQASDNEMIRPAFHPHATTTHSVSISNSIGHDATGTKLRAGGFTLNSAPG